MEISAKNTAHPEGATVNADLPETVEAFLEKFGEEVTFSYLRAQYVLGVQDQIRSALKADEDPQKRVDAWVPGVRAQRSAKSAFDKALGAVDKMSDEERAELLARLQAA